MTERELRGLAAAGGVAVGRAVVLRDPDPEPEGEGGPDEEARAVDALRRVAEDLDETAERLRRIGMEDEAEILETNRLMAERFRFLDRESAKPAMQYARRRSITPSSWPPCRIRCSPRARPMPGSWAGERRVCSAARRL